MRLLSLALSTAGALTYGVTATQLLLPLYNVPGTNGSAWSSVHNALAANPDVTATIVINVNNGPGDPSSVTTDWIAGGKALASLPNVNLIGYVHSTLCNRPEAEVTADIASWATWPANYGVDISGIFIDETPNNGSCVEYMRSLTSYARDTASLPVVVYNPGFPATPHSLDALYALGPDFISSLETCFANETNGVDLCDGKYTVYDEGGFGSTIDSTLRDWVGVGNYGRTAVLVHGFHGTNGMFDATLDTLMGMLRAVVARGVGAVVVTTNHWITPDAEPASIGNMVAALATANRG